MFRIYTAIRNFIFGKSIIEPRLDIYRFGKVQKISFKNKEYL